MEDPAQPGPSAAPVTSPIPAAPTYSEGSTDEAMLWEQYSAPDECSSSAFQLNRLPSPPASPPTDWLSLWLENYMSALPDAPVEPPVDVLTPFHSDLDETDLGVCYPTSFIPSIPDPPLSQWVPSSSPAPGVVLSPCSPPPTEMQSSVTAGAFNSSRPASMSTMPAPAWNSVPSSVTQFPEPERGKGIFQTTPPARSGLLLSHSATAIPQYNHYSPNPVDFSGHHDMSMSAPQAPHAHSVAAMLGFRAGDQQLGFHAGDQQAAPTSEWSANHAWNSGQQTVIPRRRSSWGDWQPAPVAAPMPVPRPPLLTSFGSPPSWSPRAAAPQPTLPIQTGESSTPAPRRTKFGVNPCGGPLFWWNHNPNCAMHGVVTAPEPLKELAPKRVAQSLALHKNGNPQAPCSSALDSHRMNARKKRERMNERYKTLQELVTGNRKVDLIPLFEMTYIHIITMEYQIELYNAYKNLEATTTNLNQLEPQVPLIHMPKFHNFMKM